jgi:hypothetical protein
MIVQLAPGVSPEPDGMVMTHSCWKAAPPCERKSHRVGIGYPLSASVRSSCSKAEAIQSIWLLRIPCLSGFVTPLRDGFGHLSGLENGPRWRKCKRLRATATPSATKLYDRRTALLTQSPCSRRDANSQPQSGHQSSRQSPYPVKNKLFCRHFSVGPGLVDSVLPKARPMGLGTIPLAHNLIRQANEFDNESQQVRRK